VAAGECLGEIHRVAGNFNEKKYNVHVGEQRENSSAKWVNKGNDLLSLK